jgi:RimJ/RimL family protein N-acetyltransferase
MRLDCGLCAIRPWVQTDLDSLVRYANNRNIWLQLRDRFPHPYTRESGRAWLREASSTTPTTSFAITVDAEAVGGIGVVLQDDVDRVSAEIGYWLCEPLWGRGIMTAALNRFTDWSFEAFDLTRIFALPFARNVASRRVLEKAGYRLEAELKTSAIKNGEILDQAMYARFRSPGARQPDGHR